MEFELFKRQSLINYSTDNHWFLVTWPSFKYAELWNHFVINERKPVWNSSLILDMRWKTILAVLWYFRSGVEAYKILKCKKSYSLWCPSCSFNKHLIFIFMVLIKNILGALNVYLWILGIDVRRVVSSREQGRPSCGLFNN